MKTVTTIVKVTSKERLAPDVYVDKVTTTVTKEEFPSEFDLNCAGLYKKESDG